MAEKKMVSEVKVNCSLRVAVYRMLAKLANAELQLSGKGIHYVRADIKEMLEAKDNAEFVMEDYADQIDDEGRKAVAAYEAALPQVEKIQERAAELEKEVRARLVGYSEECIEDAKQILAEADRELSVKNYDAAMRKAQNAAYSLSQIRRGYKELDIDIHETDTDFQYWLTKLADRCAILGNDILSAFYHDTKTEREASGFFGKMKERLEPTHHSEKYNELMRGTFRISDYLLGCRPYDA